MVCGGNTSGRRWGGTGVVLLYRAENSDLTEWKYTGTVFQYRNREVINIECPNLFKLDGKWVLIISPHKPCEYFVGTLDLRRPRFEPETHGVLDAGNAYASNISVDDKGRTILWLWGKTENAEAKGWNGVMVIPRILSIGADGFLRQQPAPEFQRLRGNVMTSPAIALHYEPALLEGIRGNSLDLEVELTRGRASAAGFELRRSETGKPAAAIAISDDGTLSVGGASTLIGRSDRYKLRVFVDRRVLEVYVNDGFAAVYSTLNAGSGDLTIAAFARGEGAHLAAIKAWPLKPANFSLQRFHI